MLNDVFLHLQVLNSIISKMKSNKLKFIWRITMADLLETRKKIDEVDKKLVDLFEERMKLALDVAEYKKNVGKPIYDPDREVVKLNTLQELASTEFNKKAIHDLFSQIMAMSRRFQYMMLSNFDELGFQGVDQIPADQNTKVIFFGEKGSYTEEAMLDYFKTKVNGIPKGTFREVMQDIKDGKADYGVLPIENSSTGSLGDIFDLLTEYDNYIIGEHVIKIEHHLWGLSEAEFSDIDKVYSHRQGLLQCSGFFKKNPQLKEVEGSSTSSSAKKILEDKDKSQAAIAGFRAGSHYGLKLLKKSIQNDETNSTRFIIISNKRIYYKGAKRTSLCFALPHKSGSLYHMLAHFIYNNINMTRIESRPIAGKPFEYRFFVDIEGGIDDFAVKNALHCIKEEALDLKILGSYL